MFLDFEEFERIEVEFRIGEYFFLIKYRLFCINIEMYV